ncbi:MAG: hypothetical protein B6245_18745 [Desulfobacteraceae bacterium 4572_88]|nr:MAG: hypothetical protein B6245_18745 [Desulfobacteraceae bacterium 4572_88]
MLSPGQTGVMDRGCQLESKICGSGKKSDIMTGIFQDLFYKNNKLSLLLIGESRVIIANTIPLNVCGVCLKIIGEEKSLIA